MNMLSYKALITIFFLVCVGVCVQTTEGSLFVHPYYRFHYLWPNFDTFEDDFFSDPFFRDPFDWDPFRDDRFFSDFPILHKPLTGYQRNCLSKPTPPKSSVKLSEELKLSVDVRGFAPQELTLITKGNDVIVQGEKKVCDSTSCYTRSLCWRKKLPQEIKMNTVKAKMTKENTVVITAEKKKEIGGESDTKIEIETQEKLRSQDLEKQEQAKPSDLSMKEDIQKPGKPVTEKQAIKDEEEEETTLEVVNDNDQQ